MFLVFFFFFLRRRLGVLGGLEVSISLCVRLPVQQCVLRRRAKLALRAASFDQIHHLSMSSERAPLQCDDLNSSSLSCFPICLLGGSASAASAVVAVWPDLTNPMSSPSWSLMIIPLSNSNLFYFTLKPNLNHRIRRREVFVGHLSQNKTKVQHAICEQR